MASSKFRHGACCFSDDSDDYQFEFESDDGDHDASFETTAELGVADTYTILTPDEFNLARKDTLRMVCDEMGIAAGAASAILRAFNWDLRAVRRAWDDDSIAVFTKARVDFDMCEGYRTVNADYPGQECGVCLVRTQCHRRRY